MLRILIQKQPFYLKSHATVTDKTQLGEVFCLTQGSQTQMSWRASVGFSISFEGQKTSKGQVTLIMTSSYRMFVFEHFDSVLFFFLFLPLAC